MIVENPGPRDAVASSAPVASSVAAASSNAGPQRRLALAPSSPKLVTPGRTPRVLLSGVFGPFGVDDAFGRKENIMELFENQVTKAQGIASLRFHHRSFGLYFLAENVKAPVAVLDFPSRERFIEELKKERYDAIGISFIAPNMVKAKEMARLVRQHQPWAEIILGGHGTAIENIEELIDCDHVVRGEGIAWLRKYLGEDEKAPFQHPAIPSAERKRVFGIPTPGVAGLLVPGVGCVNGCRFCSTTHFFGNYTAYFDDGETLYQDARRIAEILKTDEFFVMDENFLAKGDRARGMLAAMQRENNPLRIMVFSSADAVESFGVENLARLGVTFLWIGAESKRETYAKNAGRDLGKLVQELRDHGIFVLVSGILMLDHHTPENIWDDIQFVIDIGGTYTQFMLFTPLPQTKLYQELRAAGRIDFDLPYEEWHGQKYLNYRHPNFTREQAERTLNQAFKAEFDQLSSSAYRMLDTALRGYETLRRKGQTDSWLAMRARQMRATAQELRLLVPTLRRFAHNDLERQRVDAIEVRCRELLGPLSLKDQAKSAAARMIAEVHNLRTRYVGWTNQPQTRLDRFRWPEPKSQEAWLPGAPALLPDRPDPVAG